MTRMLLFALLVILGVVEADLAVFCSRKDNPDLKAFGDFERYKGCGNECTCWALELICLIRNEVGGF